MGKNHFSHKIKIVSIILIFSNCSYPDGPTFSVRSKTNRLVGDWKKTKQINNGITIDLTSDDKDDIWTFTKGGDAIFTNPGKSVEQNKWVFSADKSKIIINNPTTSTVQNFEIQRLTNKELSWKLIDGSKVYESDFKKE